MNAIVVIISFSVLNARNRKGFRLYPYEVGICEKEGYEIFPEYEVETENGKIRIDILGVKGKEKIAVECGTLSNPSNRLEILSQSFESYLDSIF